MPVPLPRWHALCVDDLMPFRDTTMHRIRNFTCLLASALFTALAVVACDRGSSRVEGPAVADGDRGAMREAPRETVASQPAPRSAPSLATPPRDTLSDTVITGRIKTALLTDPGMTGADVSVNTDHGVVVLTGTVKSHEQTGIASAHAQRQDGVMRVDNQLSIAPG
jgi:hyperosmotically inducible periplasmic protein